MVKGEGYKDGKKEGWDLEGQRVEGVERKTL